MNIIIVGCGKVGTRLADALSKQGHGIVVVDRDESKFSNLPSSFSGITVCGVPLDTDVLKSAGISECDALAAVTTDDNLNIVISQIAKKKFNVPRVVTRILDPAREAVFERSGLETVCPTKLASSAILNVLLGESCGRQVSFNGHSAGFSIKKDRKFIGKMICDIPVFENELVYGIISEDGSVELATDPEHIVTETEKIIFSQLVD